MTAIRLTPKRLAWLRQLRDRGPLEHGSTSIGYYCMRAGWTEWDYITAEGEHLNAAEARARFGDRYWDHVRIGGARLTEVGRLLLDGEDEI